MSKDNEFITPIKHQVVSGSTSLSLGSQNRTHKSMNDIINYSLSHNNDSDNSKTVINKDSTIKKNLSENNIRKREREEEIPEVHSSGSKIPGKPFLGNERLTLIFNSSFNHGGDGEDGPGDHDGSSVDNCITIDDSNSTDEIEDDDEDDDAFGSSSFGTQKIEEEEVKSQTPQPTHQNSGKSSKSGNFVIVDDDDDDDVIEEDVSLTLTNGDGGNGSVVSERNKMLDRINSYLFMPTKK